VKKIFFIFYFELKVPHDTRKHIGGTVTDKYENMRRK